MRELKPVLGGDVTDSLILVPADITEQGRQGGLRFMLPLDENLRTFLVEHFELVDATGSSATADSASLADESNNTTATVSGSSGESATAESGSTDGNSIGDGTAEATTTSGDSAEDGEAAGNSAAIGGAPKKVPTAPKPVLEEPRVVLSPQEIQDRIHSDQTVEELIEYSGVQPRKIESFAYPVLAERARIAELGKQSKPRRIDGPTKLSLWEILVTVFVARGQELADASWDAYRDPNGQWIMTATWKVDHTTNTAEWSYQAKGFSALTTARNELAAELINPDFTRRNQDLAPQANRAVDSADTSGMPAAWQSSAEPPRGHGEQDVPSQSDVDDDIDEAEFLQHPDAEQPKRKKKTVMPSWEDVLLGVRPNGLEKQEFSSTMSSMTSGNASNFEFFAIRRGVITIWFVSTNDLAATLETGAQHDRGFGCRFPALYDSTLPVTPIGGFPLNRSAETGDGEYCIGSFEGVAVLQTILDDISQLSKLSPCLRQEIATADVYASVSNKSTGLGTFTHWYDGELKRAFSATRYRTLEDIGLPCPAEGSLWAGKHRPLPDALEDTGSRPREGVGLSFVPVELADTVITDWLGFNLHSPTTNIPVSGFAVDGHRAALGTSYSASHSPCGLMGELGSSESGAEIGRAYDDYEVHNAEPNQDFLEELSRSRAKAKNFASRTWQWARDKFGK